MAETSLPTSESLSEDLIGLRLRIRQERERQVQELFDAETVVTVQQGTITPAALATGAHRAQALADAHWTRLGYVGQAPHHSLVAPSQVSDISEDELERVPDQEEDWAGRMEPLLEPVEEDRKQMWLAVLTGGGSLQVNHYNVCHHRPFCQPFPRNAARHFEHRMSEERRLSLLRRVTLRSTRAGLRCQWNTQAAREPEVQGAEPPVDTMHRMLRRSQVLQKMWTRSQARMADIAGKKRKFSQLE